MQHSNRRKNIGLHPENDLAASGTQTVSDCLPDSIPALFHFGGVQAFHFQRIFTEA